MILKNLGRMLNMAILVAFISSCQPDRKREEAVMELIRADMEFSKLSADSGMKTAFLATMSGQAVILHKNSMPLEGLESIRNYYDRFSDEHFTLTWQPMHARIASSGDLGYTYGTWFRKSHVHDSLNSEGTYVSIWEKDMEKKWRLVFDTGNEGLGIKDTLSLP